MANPPIEIPEDAGQALIELFELLLFQKSCGLFDNWQLTWSNIEVAANSINAKMSAPAPGYLKDIEANTGSCDQKLTGLGPKLDAIIAALATANAHLAQIEINTTP